MGKRRWTGERNGGGDKREKQGTAARGRERRHREMKRKSAGVCERTCVCERCVRQHHSHSRYPFGFFESSKCGTWMSLMVPHGLKTLRRISSETLYARFLMKIRVSPAWDSQLAACEGVRNTPNSCPSGRGANGSVVGNRGRQWWHRQWEQHWQQQQQ